MGVRIEGHRDRAVAKHLLDDLGMNVLAHQEGCKRMAEGVEGDFWYPGLLTQGMEIVAKVPAGQGGVMG